MIVYVLKCLNSNRASFHDPSFIYPKTGIVECPDWKKKKECGNGLHAFLEGEGNYTLASWKGNEVWQVIEVETDDGFVKIDNEKVKFRKGNVVYSGDLKKAIKFLRQKIGPGHPILGETVVGGDNFRYIGADRNIIEGGKGSIIISGDCSDITSGHCSIVTGCAHSTVTGGDNSIVTGGYWSTVTGGEGSRVTGGYWSSVTGGDGSTVTGGDGSIVTGGDCSIVTGGHNSTVTGGHNSTITGGNHSTVTGGSGSILHCHYYNSKGHYRTAVAYVGEDGIEPNVPYKLNSKNKFVKVEKVSEKSKD